MDDLEEGYRVNFCHERETPIYEDIVVYQTEQSWNDFKYKTKCVYLVNNLNLNDGSLIEGEILLGVLAPHDSTKEEKRNFYEEITGLNKLLISEYQEDKSEGEKIKCFTLLPSLQSYRDLVKKAGLKHAKAILIALNDLVIHKEKSESSEWIQNAEATECFRLAFMRNSEPFFAYHNASSILDGLDEESFRGISNSLSLNYKLDGFDTDHRINLKYCSDSIIPKRINILIGKNGLGKSQALTNFCRAALRYKDKHNSLTDPERDHGRPMINRLIAIGTPGETSNTFPPERLKTQKLFYRRLNLTRNSRSTSSRQIGELLVQLVRSEEDIGKYSRWKLFLNAISKVLPKKEIGIILKGGGTLLLSELRSGGEQAKLELWADLSPNAEPKRLINGESYPLSSGQLTFVKFALLTCLFIENGSFVLMDEPETHLHPNMIANFVGLLDYILEHTGSQALIATHSAYFVREVSRDQVHVFKSDSENQISIVPPRLKTFGSDVDSISQFVFEEDVESRLTDKIFEKVKNLPFEEVDRELSRELSLTALMDIKRRLEGQNEEA